MRALCLLILLKFSPLLAQDYQILESTRLLLNAQTRNIEVITAQDGAYRYFEVRTEKMTPLPNVKFAFRSGDRVINMLVHSGQRRLLIINGQDVVMGTENAERQTLWTVNDGVDLTTVTVLDYDFKLNIVYYVLDRGEYSELHSHSQVKDYFLGRFDISLQKIAQKDCIVEAQVCADPETTFRWVDEHGERPVFQLGLQFFVAHLHDVEGVPSATFYRHLTLNVCPNPEHRRPFEDCEAFPYTLTNHQAETDTYSAKPLLDAGIMVSCEDLLKRPRSEKKLD